MKRTSKILAAVILSALSCAAQEEPATIGPALPAALNGAETQLKFAAEKEMSVIGGGLSVGGTCDDNALMQLRPTTTDCFVSVLPTIRVHTGSPSAKLDLSYSPGYSIHNHLSEYDSFTQGGGIDFAYRLGPRWSMRLRDSFSITSGLTDLVAGAGQGPAFGPIGAPNNATITPISDQLSNTAGVDLGYQFTRRSGFGVGATYSMLEFDKVANTNSSLVNSDSGAASAFYSYRLTRRQTMGVTYMFQRIWFEGGSSTTIHSAAYSHAIALTPYVSLSFFAGPQYVENNGISAFVGGNVVSVPVHRQSWTPVVGATLNVHRTRTAFVANFTRRVGDGGGLSGASNITDVNARVSQRLTRDWTIYANGAYGETELFVSVNGIVPTKTGTLGGGITRQLGRNFSADVHYTWQTQNSSITNLEYGYRNRVAITLSYVFDKVLGR